MAEVTEHHGEEERERGDGVQSRIDFAVVGQSVSVDHGLEALGELVGAEVGRMLLLGGQTVQDRSEG